MVWWDWVSNIWLLISKHCCFSNLHLNDWKYEWTNEWLIDWFYQQIQKILGKFNFNFDEVINRLHCHVSCTLSFNEQYSLHPSWWILSGSVQRGWEKRYTTKITIWLGVKIHHSLPLLILSLGSSALLYMYVPTLSLQNHAVILIFDLPLIDFSKPPSISFNFNLCMFIFIIMNECQGGE